MLFHHNGYVSEDPRVKEPAGYGIDRPAALPDEVDVLIIGTGPAGMLAAAQLARFPDINTRIIERRGHRLELGQADGIQARTVETFKAFGFEPEVKDESYRITQMNFWTPDPDNPDNIIRTNIVEDDPEGLSEFWHVILNQARVLDYFERDAMRSPSKLTPDWGWEMVSLEVADSGERPVTVRLRRTADELGIGDYAVGEEREVRARYVIGADGAKSAVRKAMGRHLEGDKSDHAWGVMDALSVTDFPDIRAKCGITSKAGSILHIPREGGHLCRIYVDLGEVPEDDGGKVRQTSLDEVIAQANRILHPYTLDVKHVPWHSIYEVGHRVTDKFDDVDLDGDTPGSLDPDAPTPHVFIAGDACHTHSAKAGQGMNVSMQDTYNLGWKIAHVIRGLAPERLLHTYSEERRQIAKDLIAFDKEWSDMMAKKPEEMGSPDEVADFYAKQREFPAGVGTQYPENLITAGTAHQDVATGYPVGKRFHSAEVNRACDGNPIHLGHTHEADGRWRIYVFADEGLPGADTAMQRFGTWLGESPDSPVNRKTPPGADPNALFDVKAIYQVRFEDLNVMDVPDVFTPRVGAFGLVNLNEVFDGVSTTADGPARPTDSIYDIRGISRDGAVVVVRPDQYVSAVLPLNEVGQQELVDFFDRFLLDQTEAVGAFAGVGAVAADDIAMPEAPVLGIHLFADNPE